MKHLLALLLVIASAITVNAQEISVAEQNKSAIKKLYQIMNQKDWADQASFMFDAENYKYFKEAHSAFREVFPDYHFQVLTIAAEGDTVYIVGSVTGTHSKTWDLYPAIPATGKKVQWLETAILVLKDGKVISGDILNDRLGIMNQLGYGCNPQALQP